MTPASQKRESGGVGGRPTLKRLDTNNIYSAGDLQLAAGTLGNYDAIEAAPGAQRFQNRMNANQDCHLDFMVARRRAGIGRRMRRCSRPPRLSVHRAENASQSLPRWLQLVPHTLTQQRDRAKRQGE